MNKIIDILKKKAQKLGDKPAVFFKNTSISYKEFDLLSDKLAAYLIEAGVKENDIIPIFCQPGIERIIALFAILKAGAAYLPIPVDSSEERIRFLCEDSGACVVVCDDKNMNFQNIKCINLKNIDFNSLKPTNGVIRNGQIAYVIYTSGSTGKPKGVKVSHENLMYVLNNMQKYYPITQEDKYLLNTPYSFDVSVVEIFGWILGEGALVISELETKKKFTELVTLIDTYDITHISLSPSVIRLIYQICSDKEIEILNDKLKYLMVAGEEFQFEYAKKAIEVFNNVKIFNLYGPTEATVYATRYKVDNSILKKKYVPIGVPLDGANIKIMDMNGHEVKHGEEGEIFIYGDGVALGYHNNNVLNDEKFGEDSNGMKFYRTGDIGEFDEDGNIKFLGRNDNQVQIHGIRVELGEIENALLRFEGIEGACVSYDDEQLLAFIETNEKYVISELKSKLSHILPKYMVPSRILAVKEFPMSTNRKIDRNKLLSMVNKANITSGEKEVFQGKKEVISKLFTEVLNVEVNTSQDDFFELGGDSLAAIYLITLLEKNFNIKLMDDFLYSHSSINSICEYLDNIENIVDDAEILAHEDIKSVIDKNVLNKELNTSYEKNSENMKKGKLNEYDAYCYQKVYRNIRFDSKINVEIFIDKKVTIENIERAVDSIVNTNSVFRSFLKEKDGELIFQESNKNERYILARYKINNHGVAEYPKYQDIINEELNKSLLIYNDKYLLYNMILIEYEDGYMLQIAIDHNVADLSCVHILKKKFNDILKGKSIKNDMNYHEFIEITEDNNKDNLLTHEYTRKVNKSNKSVNKQNLKEFDDGILILRKPIKNINSNEWYINQSSYLIGQMGCEIFESPSICINTILNLRKIKGMDLSTFIGDVHTVSTMIVNKEDSIDNYEKFLKEEFDKFYIHEGKNLMHVIYKDLPTKSEYQQQLEKIYVSDIAMNLNYVGQIKEDDVESFYFDLKEMKKKLDKFEVKMLKTTVVSTEKNLYIFLLMKPVIKHELLEKFNIESIKFETES